MLGHELTVEQYAARPAQRRDQPGQRHFRCVRNPAKHRFAAEHPVEPDAVKPADQRAIAPAFDRMGQAPAVQFQIARLDSPADPGALRIGPWPGAFADHGGKISIAGDSKSAALQHFGQRARTVETVQRQDRPAARFDPENLRIGAVIGHREHAAAIGQQQHFGVDRFGLSGSMHGDSFNAPLRHACHEAV